jgi:hypothetical protein
MSTENRAISGKITTETESRERVALDLMRYVSDHTKDDPASNTREHWFKLYRQCLKLTNGYTVKKAITEE